MAFERYVLKHFYYGQFTRDGKPVGDLRLLAKTNALPDAVISEMLAVAFVPPMRGEDNGSWAVVRGQKNVPFVLVNSALGDVGQSMLHMVALPSELIRELGGNLRQLQTLINNEMPHYDTVGNELQPLVLTAEHPTPEQEIDDILDFMMDTKNRMKTMETLLSGVVLGKPVVIINAPTDPERRVAFIAGLLALLPPSVRFAVTFATHVLPSTQIDAQIRFLDRAEDDANDAVIYDWSGGTVSGTPAENSYARFIISQLRLDAELVIQQTRNLTAAASWRVKQGDRLTNALGYASQRASVDDAVRNNQPIEVTEVSRILAEDPTLSDELRMDYARHLLSLASAVNELDKAEPLGIMLRSSIDLSDITYDRLKAAIREGAAGDVFDLVAKWLANPMGPQGQRWFDLVQQSALIYFNDIIDANDEPEITLFLKDVDRAGVSVRASTLMPQLINLTKPLIETNPKLAQRLYLYAFKHVPADNLYPLLMDESFITHTPDAYQQLVSALKRNDPITRNGLLIRAVKPFKSGHRLILVRTVGLALHLEHPEIIDGAVLKQLIRATQEDWSTAYYDIMYQVVRVNAYEEKLHAMNEDDRQLLLAVLLAIGEYKELATQMLQHSRLLYPAEKQTAYAKMVQQVFANTPIAAQNVNDALNGIHENGIRSLPLIMAHIGALQAQSPSETADSIAATTIEMIENASNVLSVMPIEAARDFLTDRIKSKDVPNTLSAMRFYAVVAARYGVRSTKLTAKFYQRLGAHPELKAHRTDMLRRYIRHMETEQARPVIAQLGKALGEPVKTQLQATLTVKILTDDLSLVDYANLLSDVADLLHDTATAYVNNRNVPSEGTIHNDLDSMPGGLSTEERHAIADNLVQIGLAVAKLGQRQQQIRGGESDKRIEALLKGEENPQSAVEILRVMGGYFSDARRLELKLAEHEHPHPLPKRSNRSLLEEAKTARHLLHSTLDALPEDIKTLEADAIRAEMQARWEDVPDNQQRDLLKQLARDLQRVAELIPHLTNEGDVRALEDTNLGRRLDANRVAPRNTFEFYRYVAGYYRIRA